MELYLKDIPKNLKHRFLVQVSLISRCIADPVHRAAYKHYMAHWLIDNPVEKDKEAEFVKRITAHAKAFHAIEYIYDTYDAIKEKYAEEGQKEPQGQEGVERPELPAEACARRSVHSMV